MTEGNPIVNYTIKNDIEISHSVLKQLVKFCEASVNGHIDGILYGHEDDSKVYVEQAMPLPRRDDSSINTQNDLIVIYFNLD